MKRALKLMLAGVVVGIVGCAEHRQPTTEFPEEGSFRPHQRMTDIQRANGARGDGNLYAVHFTDDTLNSLGRGKLDLMLADEESIRPLTVHMAPAADRDTLLRRIESVTAYLKDNGLTDPQMRFVSHLNEGSYHPSAPNLANLRKTDTGEPANAPTPAPSSGTFGDAGGILVK